jgi:hypothetical protein
VLAVSTQLGWIPSMRSVPRVRLRIRGVEHQAVAGVDEAVSPSPTCSASSPDTRGPEAAKALPFGLPSDREPTREELLQAASTRPSAGFNSGHRRLQ